MSWCLSLLLASCSLPSVNPGTVVFVDVDDTLICYPYDLGSTPWFEEAGERLTPGEFQRTAALLANHLPVAPVSEELVDWIHGNQERGVKVIGITARDSTHPEVADWVGKTKEQIGGAGVKFDELIFTGWGRKGLVLQGYLTVIAKTKPERIILIDDRQSDLGQMVAGCHALEIPVSAIWFKEIEWRRALYSSERAWAQLFALKAITDMSSRAFSGGPNMRSSQ